MEALNGSKYGLWLVFAVVLLIRVPFWNQAIQGDDTIYLTEAAHALIEPLHPDNTKYVFQGKIVDLRGHPHGPVNAWVLAGLLALTGDVKEVPFHAAYTVFSLIAAWAMWSLARRFSPQPLWATLLFVAVPVFVVNGNSLETDLPFLAFWMSAMALFVAGRTVWASGALALAVTTSPQAVFGIPILGVYLWLYRRHDRGGWLALCVPPFALVGWNVFERVTTGAVPAQMLGGYLTRFVADILDPRFRLALLIHACFLICPILVPGAIALAWRKRREPDTLFLLSWIALFFAGLSTVFFAGSARYVLPIAAPLALLASRLPVRWLTVGFAANLALGLGLAAMNYQQWDGYRQFASTIRDRVVQNRVWVDDEWGLRHYMQAEGALPLTKAEHLRAGDIVVASALSHQVEITSPVLPLTRAVEIRPSIPLRIIGLETNSGYSTIAKGIWPFGVSSGLIDLITAVQVGERHPTLEYLPMAAPEAREQIVSGLYSLEDNRYRWMGKTAVLVLKSPASAMRLRVALEIPQQSHARKVSLLLDGHPVAAQTYSGPGAYVLESSPILPAGATTTIEIDIDQTFSAPPDTRELGIVLTAAGFSK